MLYCVLADKKFKLDDIVIVEIKLDISNAMYVMTRKNAVVCKKNDLVPQKNSDQSVIKYEKVSKYEISTIDSSSSSNPPPYFVVRVFSGIKRLFKYY